MVLKTGNRRNKGALTCIFPESVIAVGFTRGSEQAKDISPKEPCGKSP